MTPSHIELIRSTAQQVLGKHAQVILLGYRVNDRGAAVRIDSGLAVRLIALKAGHGFVPTWVDTATRFIHLARLRLAKR